LSNLLHNAIRHGGEGCNVTLALGHEDGHVRFSVTDDGPGMPPEELRRAGERFFRGSGRQVPGSGLGLSIVRSVAQRHGGTMQVLTGPDGRGLTVVVELATGFGAVLESCTTG
jgi:two-component system, OmpR family, sensor histidine kinase TctE